MTELPKIPGVGFDEWLRKTQDIWSQYVLAFLQLTQDSKNELINKFEQESWNTSLRNSGGNGEG